MAFALLRMEIAVLWTEIILSPIRCEFKARYSHVWGVADFGQGGTSCDIFYHVRDCSLEPRDQLTRGFSRMRYQKLTRFAATLAWHIAASGHDSRSLIMAVESSGDKSKIRARVDWRRGRTLPEQRSGFELIRKIEATSSFPKAA